MAMRLKLLVDKKTNKVVYGEAGKDFVDFFFGLLEIPLGSILRLLRQNVGTASLSLSKLYGSVSSLDSSYLQKNELKDFILNPKSYSNSGVQQTPVLHKLVTSNSYGYNSSGSQNTEGYVKGATTYMVMDDLTITPSSTISSINAVNTKGIKDLDSLQEMIVQVDGKKALEMVKASFQSTTVLTDVFIPATAAKRERAQAA